MWRPLPPLRWGPSPTRPVAGARGWQATHTSAGARMARRTTGSALAALRPAAATTTASGGNDAVPDPGLANADVARASAAAREVWAGRWRSREGIGAVAPAIETAHLVPVAAHAADGHLEHLPGRDHDRGLDLRSTTTGRPTGAGAPGRAQDLDLEDCDPGGYEELVTAHPAIHPRPPRPSG